MSVGLPAPGAHAFVDESKHRSYVVVATLVRPGELDSARKVLRGLRMSGQSRLHCRDESDRRRRLLIDTMRRLPVTSLLYQCAMPSPVEARRTCLRALVADLSNLAAQRLVLELAEGDLAADRRTLFDAIRGGQDGGRLHYEHLPSPAEPLLWIPDTVAWAWCRNAQWRQRIRPMIGSVRQL